MFGMPCLQLQSLGRHQSKMRAACAMGLLALAEGWEMNLNLNGRRPRYCVPLPEHRNGSKESTAPRLETCSAACDQDLLSTKSGVALKETTMHHARTCSHCTCRTCPQCQCADPLGRLMADNVCGRDRIFREDRMLGRFETDTACRGACNNHVEAVGWKPELCGPPYDQPTSCHPRLNQTFLRTCNSYTYADKICIAHVGSEMYAKEYAMQLQPASGPVKHLSKDRMVHGMATCAPASLQPGKKTPAPKRFVVLHTVGSFAVDAATVERFMRAHKSFATTSHLYYALQVGAGNAQEDAHATALLRAAVGERSFAFVDYSHVHSAFPRLIAQMSTMTWTDQKKPVWLVNGCDLPGLVWFSLNSASLPKDVEHVWTFQNDIGWTGSLPPILQMFDPQADLICDGLALVMGALGEAWPHSGEHNFPAGHLKAMCLLPATRMSTRLMHEQIVGLTTGRVSYCEMRAASACANADWPCRAAEFRGAGVVGLYSHFTSIDEDSLRMASSKDGYSCDKHTWKGVTVGRLFHRTYRTNRPLVERDCPMVCPGPNLLRKKENWQQQCFDGHFQPFVSTTRCPSFNDGRRCCGVPNSDDRAETEAALAADVSIVSRLWAVTRTVLPRAPHHLG